jgi:hypothetical protein
VVTQDTGSLRAIRLRRSVPSAVIKMLYAQHGGTCVIGDCPYPSRLPDGTPILEVVHINTVTPGSTRFDKSKTMRQLSSPENLILICPNHHRILDRLPEEYPAEKLLLLRKWHVDRVANILASGQGMPEHPAQANRFREALTIWEKERQNKVEDFWQKLLADRPELLMPTLSGRPYVLSEKCYVGGKAANNRNGKVPDFLAQCQGNAVLIELKTPTADLVGKEYRTGVYPPSAELTGACMQALEYRMSLMNYLHSLRFETPELSAHSPSAIVIIGDTQSRPLSEKQRRSFEIFRNSLKDVSIVTYDELFLGIENLAAMLEPS